MHLRKPSRAKSCCSRHQQRGAVIIEAAIVIGFILVPLLLMIFNYNLSMYDYNARLFVARLASEEAASLQLQQACSGDRSCITNFALRRVQDNLNRLKLNAGSYAVNVSPIDVVSSTGLAQPYKAIRMSLSYKSGSSLKKLLQFGSHLCAVATFRLQAPNSNLVSSDARLPPLEPLSHVEDPECA